MLPVKVLRLSDEPARATALLDHPVFLSPFARTSTRAFDDRADAGLRGRGYRPNEEITTTLHLPGDL